MPVAILGDRGCGKTVFLSLLFDAQVDYTNETKGAFRFYANPAYTRTMGTIVDSMVGGGWPEATLKGLLAKYWFIYGYRKLVPPNKFDSLKFTVYDIAGEDVNIIDELITPYAQGGLNSINYDDISEGLKTLLDCNVLVFLVDLQRVNAEPRTEPFEKMLKYDTFMATLISLVAEYKFKRGRELDEIHKKLYPVFVLTKFDVVDKKVFESLKMAPTYPRVEKKTIIDNIGGLFDFQSKNFVKRREYAEKAMEAFYRKTLALKYGGKLVNVDFDKAGYFFSQIITELNEDGESIPTLKKIDEVKVRLKYGYEEYTAFIDYFREIAKSMPDEVKDEQEFEVEK